MLEDVFWVLLEVLEYVRMILDPNISLPIINRACWFIVTSIHARLHEKDQKWYGRAYGNGSFIVKCFQQNRDKSEEIFNDPFIAEKIQQKNKNNILQPITHKVKGPKFPKPFLEMPSWAKCDSSLTATEVYKEQYVKPLPNTGQNPNIGQLSGTYWVPIEYLSSANNIFIYIGHPISRVFFCKFYNAPDMTAILIIIISGIRYYLQYRVYDNK
ncbi:hypothetical protein Glove_36g34 [Diversispora epigaea]|uniref:Uncharacterized protein n=1 Tax=Diversispora epigaea TaxID=1348612 RepID=A0A397JN53_9GLOM|nr:hypothetical protein Glove_36g34 [Diversispora epigaea]